MENQKPFLTLRKTFYRKIVGRFLDSEWQLPSTLLLHNPGIRQLRTKLRSTTFETLENFLTELNLYNLKPRHRFLLLEIARQKIKKWQDYFLKDLKSAPRAFLITIETLLAQNYQNTLDAWTKQGVFLWQRSFLTCISRTFDVWMDVRCWYALFNIPLPAPFWKPLNTLYRFAEQHRIQNSWFCGGTIRKNFLKLCLFEISHPQKLPSQECITLLNFLSWTAEFASLKKHFSDDTLFVIDLTREHPPVYQATHPIKSQGLWRALDLVPVLKWLTPPYVPSELAEKMVKRWTVSGDGLPKMPNISRTQVILGLSNLCALLSPQTSELIHMRPGSYCLNWYHDGTDLIPKRGDIIGVQYQLQGQWLYCIGTIKWLKRKSESQYQLGVQVLAPTFLGVHLSLSSHEVPCEGLLLPNLSGTEEPRTLITPKLTLPSGEHLILRLDGKNRVIQLTRLLHSTHQYHHYQFKELAVHGTYTR